ncbi:FtsQ-type POTRA domain-containing protein [Fibrobacter sp. UWB10]|uniref:cell division protein FtsQ/DivIB n=1 Tax=Fibrobacter sp. UWB10 TaxID=1896201 RepID=UPI00156B7D36|nr:FtsQ-type POTRA domain-containing protein [Fibrobacter sp. UWB10]MBO7512249.1 FtsQ-type POTRA domain-containing protein [Fibrobacter sp.]SMP44552.1 cell division protein FtsQ [Fibrobacter sp. UWB10]
MTGTKTTFLGRRIGTNERLRKQERVRKLKSGVSSVWHWFKRRGWIFTIILVVLAVLAIHNRFYLQHFNPLELRHLQYVEIEGNRMLSWEDVMQGAQVETGMLMSELNADSVEASLMQLPMILSAKVEKKFPSSLYIKLHETSPVLTVLSEGRATIYSEKGYPLPFSVATAMRLPVMDVTAMEHVKSVTQFLVEMRSYDAELYNRVSQVSWSSADDCMKVYFRDVGFTALFKDLKSNKDQFTLYKSLENGFAKDLLCAGEVDMRYSGFAYVRNYDKRCVNG